MIKKFGFLSLSVIAWVFASVSAFAEPAVQANTGLSYSCQFTQGNWNIKDWQMVKSPRWDHLGEWIQKKDCIQNATPVNATAKDLGGAKAGETYTSMVLKQKASGRLEISSTLSFEDQYAPLIVLADNLGQDTSGHPEYRNHTEIVIYDGGINIWQHYYRDGKPSWVKVAWENFKLKSKTKYHVQVKVDGNRIEVTAGGHTLGCTDLDLPSQYYVGVTACEGINNFYEFGAKSL